MCSNILEILRKQKRSGYTINKTVDSVFDVLQSKSQIKNLKNYELKEIVRYIDRFSTSKLKISGSKVKSRKYQGVFEVKSRAKTWQVRGIWSQQLEH